MVAQEKVPGGSRPSSPLVVAAHVLDTAGFCVGPSRPATQAQHTVAGRQRSGRAGHTLSALSCPALVQALDQGPRVLACSSRRPWGT